MADQGREPDIIWEGQVDFARPREIAVLPIPEEGAVLEISRCETGRCVYVRIRRQRNLDVNAPRSVE